MRGFKVAVRKIERELFVASASFHIGGSAVGRTDDGFAVHETRRPGDADARIPVAEASVVVVQGSIAVTGCAGNHGLDIAGLQAEVDDAVVYLVLRRVVFETDAEV